MIINNFEFQVIFQSEREVIFPSSCLAASHFSCVCCVCACVCCIYVYVCVCVCV